MKEIINVANIDPSEKAGGLNLMVKNIVSTQNQLGLSSLLLYFSETRYKDDKIEYPNIKYNGFISFLRGIKRNKHYVFHSIYNKKYIFMMLMIKLLGANYSIHAHGSLSKHCIKKSFLKKSLYLLIIKIMTKMSSFLIFSNKSEHENSIIKKTNRIIYIPNLIPNIEPITLTRDFFRIVYIGKIDYYYKGISQLLIAFSEFIKTNNNFKLELYGFGNKKNIDLNNICSSEQDIIRLKRDVESLNLQNNVKFLGPIIDREKINTLCSTGAFILTSNSEAMPLSISEALACGTPVIISKQTNMGNYIKQYGSGIVCDNTPESILDALIAYKSELIPEYNKVSEQATKCFINELSSDQLPKFILELTKCIK
ncbi:glycosyltransferase [Providencia rettgeri]|uniref:glycosyltransferase n=1 Tax=Providencia rettgeri TaxID=587 RepID=UPI001ADACC0D|nr:glycosyltransferase [Providencia rettgeri]MBO8256015.1 glycosyltransferase [Providencia rettgeri]MBO8259844.1 glycosyltransferase [Providencia rettgeri]